MNSLIERLRKYMMFCYAHLCARGSLPTRTKKKKKKKKNRNGGGKVLLPIRFNNSFHH